jgi:hypothetical protein
MHGDAAKRENLLSWIECRGAMRMQGPRSAALVNAQHELAFRKRRLRDRGFDPELDPLVAARRVQIHSLRARLNA